MNPDQQFRTYDPSGGGCHARAELSSPGGIVEEVPQGDHEIFEALHATELTTKAVMSRCPQAGLPDCQPVRSSGEQVPGGQLARRALSRSSRFQGIMPSASQPPLTSQMAQEPRARPQGPYLPEPPNRRQIVTPGREINYPSARTRVVRSPGCPTARGQSTSCA